VTERILIDNDIIIKVALWHLGDEMLASTTVDDVPPAMLGVGRFVVADRLSRAAQLSDSPAVTLAWNDILSAMKVIEPTDEEIEHAADLEAEASRLGVDLDPGESQLLAILIRRRCTALMTGDKRAIEAIEMIAPVLAEGRIACLEQLIADFVRRTKAADIRTRVCARPNADRAITACFACASINLSTQIDIQAGLESYIRDLRRSACTVLLQGTDLSALSA
jgi:hypothetical protein